MNTINSLLTRLVVFLRAVAVLALVGVAVPIGLMWAARRRFGGSAPFHGVPSPTDWDVGRIVDALTERLSESTIADIVIRLSLAIVWVAVVVFVATVVLEAVHMARHGGFPMPAVRGLGSTQRMARAVAAGLLVLVPMLTNPARAVAHGAATLSSQRAAVAAVDESDSARLATVATRTPTRHAMPTHLPTPAGEGSARAAVPEPGTYTVRAGDSVYGIAARLAGPDQAAIASYAERIIDLNMGRQMLDGQRFANAAFIDVGWVLALPGSDASSALDAPDVGDHTVVVGESLWSIAEDELGDGTRWPELYDANAGRVFDDGRRLDDPDLIHPGWQLDVPGVGDAVVVPVSAPPPAAPDVDDPVVTAEATADQVASALTEPAERDERDDLSDAPTAGTSAARPASEQAWVQRDELPSVQAAAEAGGGHQEARHPAGARADAEAAGRSAEMSGRSVVSMERAAMLSAGVLALVAVLRRRRLRQSAPRVRLPAPSARQQATERMLRTHGADERLARVDIAVRSATRALVEAGVRVLAVTCSSAGDIELRATGACQLAAPWQGAGDRWALSASTPIELLADQARQVGAACPLLVQVGVDAGGGEVYLDLEALEALEVGGSPSDADAIVAALAATLAASVFAEVATLVSVGVAPDAFLGHRLHRHAADVRGAFEIARRAIGATAAMAASTFDLRARGTSGEAWEPAVVLVGAELEAFRAPDQRRGLALVSASPIVGPSSMLAPEGELWVLRPAGLAFRPIGLVPDDIAALADLVAAETTPLGHRSAEAPAPPVEHAAPLAARTLLDPDDTVYGDDRAEFGGGGDDRWPTPTVSPQHPAFGSHSGELDDRPIDDPLIEDIAEARIESVAGVSEETGQPLAGADWSLLVRLLGAVDVVDRDGTPVEFERSKTRELIAWLATHRDRATRQNARTALWDQDVRDSTFSNVVSEARRAMARLVPPPEGEEWVGRTLNDALPLHIDVVTDVDLVASALEVARVQPPAAAIATLTPVVELVTGLPFEGAAYLWPDAEGITSQLVLVAVTAATELGQHCLSMGDIEGVFAATARGLRVLSGHEELIGLRMRAHARAGDLAGVRQEWESYERTINADPWSDGEPAPKLVELRKRLMQGG